MPDFYFFNFAEEKREFTLARLLLGSGQLMRWHGRS
jgi:hypothetical protein